VQADEIYKVDLLDAGIGSTYVEKNGYVPLFLGMPIAPAVSAGGEDQTINSSVALAAGSYGALRVKSNGVLTLTGGSYAFTSIDVDPGGQLLVAAPATVEVSGRVQIGSSAIVGASGGPAASEAVFWVAGSDGPGEQLAFRTGNGAQLSLNAYAFNGTLSLGPDTIGTGAFLGARVQVGNGSVLNLDSSFDYPYP
jgi:hypothetical protein